MELQRNYIRTKACEGSVLKGEQVCVIFLSWQLVRESHTLINLRLQPWIKFPHKEAQKLVGVLETQVAAQKQPFGIVKVPSSKVSNCQ